MLIPNNTAHLPKSAILRRKTDIKSLYDQGTHYLCFPIKATILLLDNSCIKQGSKCQVIFSVSKKYHKHAVDRNLLRRRVKEAFRLAKPHLDEMLEQHGLVLKLGLSCVSNEILEYKIIKNAVDSIVEKVGRLALSNTN